MHLGMFVSLHTITMLAQHRLGSSSGTCGSTAAACQRHSLTRVPVCRTPHQTIQLQRLGVLRATAAAAEGADAEQQQEQQQQKQQSQQQQSKDKDSPSNFTRARAKRLARVVQDSSTPNTGIVSLTAKSSVSGAAACVAADFKTNRLTRIVPYTEDQTQRAVATLKLANTMVNADLASQAADQGRDYVKQTLVFQPVEVMGDMAAPPALPLGANTLYACCLPIDDPTLQAALKARSAALAAGDYYPSSGSSSSSSSSGTPLRALTVNSGSNHIKLADILSYRLSTDGWVELATQGRPDYALPVAVQALVKLRRVRYGRHKEDATVLLLGDEDVLGADGRSLPPAQQGMFLPVSFLVVRCAKNYSTKLLPLPTKSDAAASDS